MRVVPAAVRFKNLVETADIPLGILSDELRMNKSHFYLNELRMSLKKK